jgi:hypothetical protein
MFRDIFKLIPSLTGSAAFRYAVGWAATFFATGGSAGPEGSILALLVLFLCVFLIHLRFPDPIFPGRPYSGVESGARDPIVALRYE